MRPAETLLEEALALTRRMLELACKDEWEEVKSLESRQGGLLRDCFESGSPIADRAAVADKVQQILDLNQQIIALGEQSRDRIAQGMSQLQKGRAAVRAYLDNS